MSDKHNPSAPVCALGAGAAAANITPALGTLINGNLGPGVAEYIHDDLWARALVLDDDTTRVAVVVVDATLLDREVCDTVRGLVERHTHIAADHVMISCTHTHSGGSVVGAHLADADPDYRAWIPRRIADAVRCAAGHVAPAEIAWGSTQLPQHLFCRRLRLKPGTTYTNQLGAQDELAKMNWDSPHPSDGEPAGPVDPELSVLAVRHLSGAPLAVLANYSLHYVGDVGPGHISADYFGVFSQRIEQLLGAQAQDPRFIGMMSNGTSGDVNNINPRIGWHSPAQYTFIRQVAEDVAQAVHRVYQSLTWQRAVELRSAWTECQVAARRPQPTELEQARHVVAGRTVDQLTSWPENYAREQLLLADWPPHVSLPLQVLRIGDLAIAGWPGEIFAATGIELKRRSPIQPLFNIELANGWFGYIPPPSQFALGAYETWRMRTSPLEVDAIEHLMAAHLRLLQGLH